MSDFIPLGATVRDVITGFEGMVVCRSIWLTGNTRLGLQAKKLKGGRPQEEYWVDELRCRILDPGGPNR